MVEIRRAFILPLFLGFYYKIDKISNKGVITLCNCESLDTCKFSFPHQQTTVTPQNLPNPYIMKPNLTFNQTFGSSQFSSLKPNDTKTQGQKIRQKKLQTKYKQLIQKHQTMKKFTPNFVSHVDAEEVAEQFVNEFVHIDSVEGGNEAKTRRVLMRHIKEEGDEEVLVQKRNQFLTARDFLQRTKSNSKRKANLRPSIIKSNSYKSKLPTKIMKSPGYLPTPQPQQPEYLISLSHQNFLAQQLVVNLDTYSTSHTLLWQKFLQSVKQILTNQQMLCLPHVCDKDRNVRLVNDFMKQMDFLLQQQDRAVIEVSEKIRELKELDLKTMYLQVHQLHIKLTQAKNAIHHHEQQYNQYLTTLQQQQKQRKLMLQSKRQTTLNKPHTNTNDNSPLRYLHKNLNLNQRDLKIVMEKKSKLNMELDLSFQIQQRKKIAKEKELFHAKKIKLEKEKTMIQTRMNDLKQKIDFREKLVEKHDLQKDKYIKEIEYFFKMLLKNPQYRLDGAVWTFKKMIQYGFQVQMSDFSEQLDFNARNFLINEFKIMKEQQVFTIKPIESKKERLMTSRKLKKTTNNRQRVKSVTLSSAQQQNKNPMTIKDNLNSNIPPNFSDNAFFTFACKNLNPPQNLNIRKKSGSLTLIKIHDESLDGQTESNEGKIQTSQNSFRSLTKENNRNKLYYSAKKYIKNWIGEKGWNTLTNRTVKKVQDNKNEQKFISQEKARAKQQFFKIGRSNTRYNSIVKTLYGSQEDLKAQNKRLKTCHQ